MKHIERIMKSVEKAERKAFKENEWGKRHAEAWRGNLHPLPVMIKGWALYADWHEAKHASRIGEDYVLGPSWKAIGEAFLNLLNGELGQLDGGTLDRLIRECLQAEGWEE